MITLVRNDCRSIKRYAIFKFVTQFRLLRRECGHVNVRSRHLWHANFHVDIQYSFMSYRHTFIDCLFFYSHSTNQLRNQIVFSNYFHYSLLVGIFGMERLPLKKCESWPILCFFLTPPTSAVYVHPSVNGFNENVIPSFLSVMSTHMMTTQLLSLRCTSKSSSLLRPKVGSNIEF